MDYEFIEHLVNRKLGLVREQFPKLFGDKAYPMVTECMVQAAKNDASCDRDVLKLMSSFERAPCGHQTNIKSAEDCLRDCFAEPRYCLAGRCKWSMKMAYFFPHVLVLMWDLANVLVLRAPSENSKLAVEHEMEGKRSHMDELERKMTKEAIMEEKRERAEKNKATTSKIAHKMRLQRKPIAKGPNPMSMRKPMSQADRAKKRSTRNPFMQFGGASAMNDGDDPFDDPSFISRSKLRKKRKRVHDAAQKAEARSIDSIETATAAQQEKTSESAPIPTVDSESNPAPKFRKRRKPKNKDNAAPAELLHTLREGQRERDIAAEAKASSE